MENYKSINSGIKQVWTHFVGAASIIAFLLPVAVLSLTQPVVNLGTAGDFVVLAKTGISATGTTSIVGDIGVSPEAATAVTGFGLIMDASGRFSTSSLITGNVYAADYTVPTPTKMTTAIGDLETAYTNAAGRTLPDFSELYTGDVTGKTLVPGLYKWTTSVLVSAAGVTISGSATDVWIFQIAQNLELANGAIVMLAGGALASNIFWQVAGQVTMGTTSDMKGIILCQTAIVMRTGATLRGMALAQTAITLDGNIVRPATVGIIGKNAVSQKDLFSQTIKNQSIEFWVPLSGRTVLSIVDPLGKQVAMLFDGDILAGKYNSVKFNTARLSKGMYYSKLACNGLANFKKMVIVQ
jgi:hypothetical protein